MYLQRAAVVWIGALLGFLACTMEPTSGTSSTTTSTGTAGGGTGGTGGMDAGTCEGRQNYYDICGYCLLCVEEKCCPELIACESTPGCIDCAAHSPDADIALCGTDAQTALVACSGKCEWCHTATPDPGCPVDGGSDGG